MDKNARDHICCHIFLYFSSLFYGNTFFLKSQKGNEIWTFLKMSRNENPKKVLKMTFFSLFHHNGLNFILRVEKTVMLIFQLSK